MKPHLSQEMHDSATYNAAFLRAKTEYHRAFGDPIIEMLEDQWAGFMVSLDRIGPQRWKLPGKIHRLAARCRSAHLAGRTSSARRLLAHADELTSAPETLLLEPLVQLAIEIGDFDRVEAMCARLVPSETSMYLWMSAMHAVAASGDHDRVERMNRTISDDTDRVYGVMGATEADASQGLYERVGVAMNYLSKYPIGELATRRVVDAFAGRGDYDHALAFARHIADWDVRAETLISIVDIALEAGDLSVAGTVAEVVSDVDNQLRMATDVAVQAVRHDDMALVARMAGLVRRPAEQAEVWLKAAAAGSGVFRARAIATALRLTRWHEAVEAVVEAEPSAFGVVLDEFTTVQD